MGVIQRQGIKNSIVSYFGVVLGFVSSIYIYPIDLEAKGLMEYFLNIGTLFLPYAQLGVIAVYNKYFAKLQSTIASFQKWILKKIIYQFIVFTILFYLLRHPISDFLLHTGIDVNGSFLKYSFYIPILIFLILIQTFFLTLCVTNKRTAVAELINSTIQKIYFPLIVILNFTLSLEANTFIVLILFYYFITIPILYIYTKKLNFFKLSIFNRTASNVGYPVELKKEIRTYNLFSLLNDISAQLCYKLDTIMVASFIGFTQTGIYTSMIFMANVMIIPSGSIMRISNPIVATHMAENNYSEVEILYKKVSVTSLISGIVLFLFIWFMFEDVLSITKYSSQLKIGKIVFLIIALSNIFDMLTSINSDILVYSKLYKYNIVFILFLGVGNIVFNLIFIPKYGFEGAAIASLLVVGLYNISKLIFIYVKLNMHPFTKKTVVLFLIAGINFLVLNIIPDFNIENIYLLLIVKTIVTSGILLTLYVLPIYYFRISDDVNKLVDKFVVNRFIKK